MLSFWDLLRMINAYYGEQIINATVCNRNRLHAVALFIRNNKFFARHHLVCSKKMITSQMFWISSGVFESPLLLVAIKKYYITPPNLKGGII